MNLLTEDRIKDAFDKYKDNPVFSQDIFDVIVQGSSNIAGNHKYLDWIINKWIKSRNGKLSALIFDHGIRDNSKHESLQVKSILKNLNIHSIILRPKKNYLSKKNMSQARTNRFDSLINFCKKNKIFHLFLGHHYDDNIETYLIRKINGSNFEGLGSMEEISYFNNIQILRPFLQIKKTSILKFNKKNNLNFVNDPSNKDLNYTRVKVRNFLQSKKYQDLVNNDFKVLKKEIPFYKGMIWTSYFQTLSYVTSNELKINRNILLKLDKLIIEKIILISLKFFSEENFKVRSAKIAILINEIKKSNFNKFILRGVLIVKKDKFLSFSKK